MAELIYAYIPHGLEGWRDETKPQYKAEFIIEHLKEQGGHGVYMIDPVPNVQTLEYARKIQDAGLDFILAFRWPTRGRAEISGDIALLEFAKTITPRLALGNVATNEWYGGMDKSPIPGRKHAQRYLDLAHHHGFEWVCTITHRTICHDIFDRGSLKPVLKDTLCVCLCGYILVGYVYGDVRMPHQRSTSLGKTPLGSRYGLNAARLKGWLSGMNCLTGAGFQTGLDGGIRVYAKEIGFTGFVSGVPFDLTGTLDVPILPPMSHPPQTCGVWEDYQNRDIVSDDEKPWLDKEGR